VTVQSSSAATKPTGWRSILFLLRPQLSVWPWFLGGIILSVGTITLGLLLFFAVGAKIAQSIQPAAMQWLDTPTVFGITVGVALLRVLALSRTLVRYAERIVTHSALFRGLTAVRLWMFDRLIPLAPAQLSQHHTGDLMGRLTADIDALDGLYLRLVVPCSVLITIVGACVVVALLGFEYAWLVLMCLLMFALILAVAFAPALFRLSQTNQAELTLLRTQVTDGLEGMAELVSFHASDRQQEKLLKQSVQIGHTQQQVAGLLALSGLLVAITSGALVAGAAYLVPQGPYYWPILMMMVAMGEVLALGPGLAQGAGRLQFAARRLVELASLPPLVVDGMSGGMPMPHAHAVALNFEHVTFTYPGRDKPALRDVSFHIPAGARVLITGESGAGKSSIAQLLLRFWPLQSGRISVLPVGVAGEPIDFAQLSGAQARQLTAYLSQSGGLISGTIADNLRLAKPDASEDELNSALSAVQLGELIASLPDGLFTWIGENGARLSGGQMRRVALARLLLKDAPIWLCDEPTEGLDEAVAREVLAELVRLAGKRSLILITHQPELVPETGIWHRLSLQDGQICPEIG
jgi:ATP-binding cassette subfamily C protein CydC